MTFTRIIKCWLCLPFNHIEGYARHSLTGWTYQICELKIWDDHIQEVNNISMETLERDYGRKNKKS